MLLYKKKVFLRIKNRCPETIHIVRLRIYTHIGALIGGVD